MKYVCLVHGEESHLAGLDRESLADLDRRSLAYDRSLEKAGKLVVAEALQSSSKSTIIRKRSGKVVAVDGPFAETKEQLLGFVMIDADSREEALEIAAGIPIAEWGAIEVRAVYDVPEG